ncbi:AI-2E family transporter [Yoonia algicola]|uniref:AI-2E family transporter n=1 Tax=Yoonia algicola TaxID=3137368 RepID=A0AAN0MF75_9RHOB
MRSSINSLCLVAIAVVLVFATLYQAKALFAPVLSAALLGVVLTPLSELWDKLRIPSAIAAFLSVSLAVAAIFVIFLLLEPYISKVISQAPVIQAELRETVDEVRRILQGLERISDDMSAAIEPNPVENGEDEGSVPLPSVADALFYAPQFLAQFLIFTGTLYFFLLARNTVYEWLSHSISALGKRDLRRAASQVSRYVLTISAINLCFGALVTVAMQVIGMPSPIVWGMLAFLLNFILYLGPIVLIAMLTVTGIVVFDGAASFLPPAIYIAMNATEAQFVTPTLVGRSLSVNPLLVFLSLVFWLWLWGPIGGIIAIPLLIWTLTVVQGMNGQAISDGTPGKG